MMYSSCESELLTLDEDLTIMTQSMTLIEADVILKQSFWRSEIFPLVIFIFFTMHVDMDYNIAHVLRNLNIHTEGH